MSTNNAGMKGSPRVVVICSLSSKDKCMEVVERFQKLFGEEVYHPFLDQRGSLYRIQKNYLKMIDAADFVIAIPKESNTVEIDQVDPTTDINCNFGESTSYELAYARHIGKPVMILGEGW